MRTLDKIITRVNTNYGAPMGRPSKIGDKEGKRLFDCKVPLDSGGYDKGGAYWGFGGELRVEYTKDLEYVAFYRLKMVKVDYSAENGLIAESGYQFVKEY